MGCFLKLLTNNSEKFHDIYYAEEFQTDQTKVSLHVQKLWLQRYIALQGTTKEPLPQVKLGKTIDT